MIKMWVQPQHERDADLVCEALVREIRRAGRWTAIMEACGALLAVRRRAKDMSREQEMGDSMNAQSESSRKENEKG